MQLQDRQTEIDQIKTSLLNKVINGERRQVAEYLSTIDRDILPLVLNGHFGYSKETLLHLCAKRGLNEIMLDLIDHGSSVHEIDSDGNSALMIAATVGNEYGVGILRSKGARVNLQNQFGETALHLMMRKGNDNPEMVAFLVRLGANLDITDNKGNTALHDALTSDCRSSIPALLAEGANPDIVNKIGVSPLYLAVLRGNRDAVFDLLATNKVEVTAVINPYVKNTVISEAAQMSQHGGILELLLRAGVNQAHARRVEIIRSRGLEAGHNKPLVDFVDHLHYAWKEAKRVGNDVAADMIEETAKETKSGIKSVKLWNFGHAPELEDPAPNPADAELDEGWYQAKEAGCAVM